MTSGNSVTQENEKGNFIINYLPQLSFDSNTKVMMI